MATKPEYVFLVMRQQYHTKIKSELKSCIYICILTIIKVWAGKQQKRIIYAADRSGNKRTYEG